MLTNIDLLIFDLDGALVDSEAAICETFNHVLAQKRLPLADTAVVSRMIGQPLREMYATCLPHATEEEIEELFTIYARAYGAFSRQHTRLLPGANELLSLLSPSKTISLATTKARAVATDVLTDVGLYPYFDLVLGVDDVTFPKPHPEIVLKALATFEVEPHRAVMIGDTTFDIDAGRAAGVQTIGVLTGTHSREELERSRPTHIVDSLHELT